MYKIDRETAVSCEINRGILMEIWRLIKGERIGPVIIHDTVMR